MCRRRGPDTLWELKKVQKKLGADLYFDQNVFWRLLGPDDTESDRSQKNFFAKQISMMFLSNDHFPIFVF